MTEFLAAVPALTAAVVAALVAFLRGTLANQPPTIPLRLCDALICGIGAMAVVIIIRNHVTAYTVGDSIAIAFGMGYLGAGRISEMAVRLAKKKLKLGDHDE